MEKVTKALAILFVFGIIVFIMVAISAVTPKKVLGQSTTTFWKYQCIDTMKISRDDARKWAEKPDLQDHIAWEMKTIKDLGANCVAIDTPYDSEFLPYLTQWVKAARTENLHVWFRGNFAGWETWFNYPKLADNQLFFTKLKSFISDNANLFADGDIFTGAPEAENGGPYDQVEKNEYDSYRKFLIDEYQIEHDAFAAINKNVQLNWQSMNGGLAKRMYDQNTIDKTEKTITIDHYINSADQMGEYINYFNKTYKAQVNIGEFGAPIPDINGEMTEDQQAEFVEKLFAQLYDNRELVNGVNYWDLYDGSTALMNPDQTPRKVAAIVKKYFTPAIIAGIVTDDFDEPIVNVQVSSADGKDKAITDKNGYYSFPTVQDNLTLVTVNGANMASQKIGRTTSGEKITQNIQIEAKNLNLVDQTRLFVYKLKKGKY